MSFRAIILLVTLTLVVADQPFGKITLPLGKVDLQNSLEGGWTRARPNQPVFEGNIIRTLQKSRCEITLTGGGKVRIGEQSELVLNQVSVRPMVKNFSANLKRGNIWVSAKAAFGEKKNISVRTPTAVAAIRGTKFRAKAGDDESSVLVYDGRVDVNQAKNAIERRKEMRKSLAPEKPKFKLGPVKQIAAPTEVAGPFEVTLEEWISLVDGMQVNVRKDGKYHLFQFDQKADAEQDFVRWNKEQDAAEK
jgi:hypothetical protein